MRNVYFLDLWFVFLIQENSYLLKLKKKVQKKRNRYICHLSHFTIYIFVNTFLGEKLEPQNTTYYILFANIIDIYFDTKIWYTCLCIGIYNYICKPGRKVWPRRGYMWSAKIQDLIINFFINFIMVLSQWVHGKKNNIIMNFRNFPDFYRFSWWEILSIFTFL